MNLNLLGHDKSRLTRRGGATGPSEQNAGSGAPQIPLETALLAALQVHAAHPDNAPLPGEDFRRRLGYDRISGESVRLLVGLQLYGLAEREGQTYTLTREALHLLETTDEEAFKDGLKRAATLPALLRELLDTYSADLDSQELRDDLRGRRLPENERQALLKVLRDNRELTVQPARQRALFDQVGRQSPSRRPYGQERRVGWLRTLPGRTANLTLAAVVFVACLVGAALLPGLQQPASEPPTARAIPPAGRTIPVPVAVVSVPEGQSSPSDSRMPQTRTAETGNSDGRTPGRFDHSSRATGGDTATAPFRTVPTARTPAATVRSQPSARAQSSRAVPATTAPTASVSATRPDTAASTRSPTASSPSTQTGETLSSTAPSSAARSQEPQTTAAALSPLAEAGPLELGRRLTSLLYSQRLTRLWKTFSPGVQQEWGSFPAFREYRLGGLAAYGAETRVVSEEVRSSGGVTYYLRTATFERGPDHPWTLILGLGRSGQVVEFNIVSAGVLPGLTASAEH